MLHVMINGDKSMNVVCKISQSTKQAKFICHVIYSNI